MLGALFGRGKLPFRLDSLDNLRILLFGTSGLPLRQRHILLNFSCTSDTGTMDTLLELLLNFILHRIILIIID